MILSYFIKLAKKIFRGFILGMKINPIQQNPNFKGYKNLICDMYEDPNHTKFAFMSMQLTNDQVNDLADWELIQKELYREQKTNDVITFQLLKGSRGNNFYFANRPLTMRMCQKSTKEEKLALKAHSLIASLSRRVFEQSMATADNEMPRVFSETIKNLRGFFICNLEEVSDVVYKALTKNISDHKIAGTINKAIQKNMRAYFK